MKMKYIYLIFALLACSILFAEPTYMPVSYTHLTLPTIYSV